MHPDFSLTELVQKLVKIYIFGVRAINLISTTYSSLHFGFIYKSHTDTLSVNGIGRKDNKNMQIWCYGYIPNFTRLASCVLDLLCSQTRIKKDRPLILHHKTLLCRALSDMLPIMLARFYIKELNKFLIKIIIFKISLLESDAV